MPWPPRPMSEASSCLAASCCRHTADPADECCGPTGRLSVPDRCQSSHPVAMAAESGTLDVLLVCERCAGAVSDRGPSGGGASNTGLSPGTGSAVVLARPSDWKDPPSPLGSMPDGERCAPSLPVSPSWLGGPASDPSAELLPTSKCLPAAAAAGTVDAHRCRRFLSRRRPCCSGPAPPPGEAAGLLSVATSSTAGGVLGAAGVGARGRILAAVSRRTACTAAYQALSRLASRRRRQLRSRRALR